MKTLASICITLLITFGTPAITQAQTQTNGVVATPTSNGTRGVSENVRGMNYFFPFLTSLCGAFFGAIGAYWIGRWKENRDEVKRRHTALLATQYALFSQRRIIDYLRTNILDPVRADNGGRHLKMLTYFPPEAEFVPFKDLTFVIDSDDANLLQEVHNTQLDYLAVIKALEYRNQLFATFMKDHAPVAINAPETMAKFILKSTPSELFEIEKLKNVVDSLYKLADSAAPHFDDKMKKVGSFIKRHFKNKRAMATERQSHVNPNT